MRTRIAASLLALLAVGAWLFTLNVARAGFHMTPDAVDYLTIARQSQMGRGWTHPIKWHWFDEAPAVHSALGERPLAWPMLAKWAVLIDQRDPAVPAQVMNTVLLGMAAATWGVVAALVAGAALSGWLTAALMLTSASVLFSTVAALTEPLYLLVLGLLALVMSPQASERLSPIQQGGLAGLITFTLHMTRPTGPIVVLAVLLSLLLSPAKVGERRRFTVGLVWAGVFVGLLIPWLWATHRAWGDPFHNLTANHLHVMGVTDRMISGWGEPLPAASTFVAAHWSEILAKIGDHVLLHAEAVLEIGALGLLAPLLALVIVQAMGLWRGWSLLWLLAAGHWLGSVITWATTEPQRLSIPVWVCLLPLCLAAGARLLSVGGEGRRAMRLAALLICATTLALNVAGLWMKAHALRQIAWPARFEAVPLPFAYDPARVVCTNSPFLLTYRSDLATVVFPSDLPERFAHDPFTAWARFIDQYNVAAFALTSIDRAEALQPLMQIGLLRPLSVPDPRFVWFEVVQSGGQVPPLQVNP